MGTPKIGRKSKIEEAARNIDDLKPSDEERKLGSYDAIVEHREREKAALIGQPAPKPEAAPTVVAKPVTKATANIEDMLASLTKKTTDANAALLAERKAVIDAEVGPLLEEAQSLLTKHGILVNKHLAHVSNINTTDWPALYKVVPAGLEFDTKANRMVPKNHDAIWKYAEAAKVTASNLRSTFGDQQQGKDVDPVSLQAAVHQMNILVAGRRVWDEMDGVTTSEYRRALSHLRVWVERGRRLVESTVDSVDRFYKAEAAVKEILANVQPLPVAGEPPRATLRDLGERPPGSYSDTSFQDFDPRDHDSQRAPSGPEVVRTNQGIRVGSIRPLREHGDGKTVGITGGA